MKPRCGYSSRIDSFLLVREASDEVSLAVGIDIGIPVSISWVPVNSRVTASIIAAALGVPQVLNMTAYSKVVSAVVKFIAVDVVNLFAVSAFEFKNLAMHGQGSPLTPLKPNASAHISVWRQLPFPFSKMGVVSSIYNRNFPFGKRNQASIIKRWAGFLLQQVHGRLSKDVQLAPYFTRYCSGVQV